MCEAAASSGVSAASPEEHQHCVNQKTHAFAVRYAEQKGKEVEALTESIQQLRSYVQHWRERASISSSVTAQRAYRECADDVLNAIGGK